MSCIHLSVTKSRKVEPLFIFSISLTSKKQLTLWRKLGRRIYCSAPYPGRALAGGASQTPQSARSLWPAGWCYPPRLLLPPPPASTGKSQYCCHTLAVSTTLANFFANILRIKQCCGSRMFIPDYGSDFFPSRIPDPNCPSQILDPRQRV